MVKSLYPSLSFYSHIQNRAIHRCGDIKDDKESRLKVGGKVNRLKNHQQSNNKTHIPKVIASTASSVRILRRVNKALYLRKRLRFSSKSCAVRAATVRSPGSGGAGSTE